MTRSITDELDGSRTDASARPGASIEAEPGTRGTTSPGTMLAHTAANIGPALLQRKLARRALQRRAAESTASAAPAPSGPGAPMPEGVRERMEGSFGQDFSSVRVHEGNHVGSIGAVAYTQGTDIHFQPGHYDPGSRSGQQLLGHELAHVVQQSEGRVPVTAQTKGVDLNDDSSLEREADEAGVRAANGEAARAGAKPSSPGVQAGAAQASGRPVQAKGAGVIQRAVGFEFEAFTWSLTNEGGDAPPKGFPISKRPGYNIEAEDKQGGMTVEFVAKPLSTRGELVSVVGGIAKDAQSMADAAGPFDLTKVGGKSGYSIDTSTPTQFGLQASPSVPLDRVAALAKNLDKEDVTRYGASMKLSVDAVRGALDNDERFRNRASQELEGLLILIVEILRRGANVMGQSQFPKNLLSIMSRTTFTKMFSMVPEAEELKQHLDGWVELVMSALNKVENLEGRDLKGNEPVFNKAGFTVMPERVGHEDEDRGKKVAITTTREQWLRDMPEVDRLSGVHDGRIEGMGVYGGITDKLVDQGAQQGAKILEKLKQESESESESEEQSSQSSPSQEPPRSESKSERREASTSKEAPLFELRQVGGNLDGPNDFYPRAEKIFNAVDGAIGGSRYDMDKEVDRSFLTGPKSYKGDFEHVQDTPPVQGNLNAQASTGGERKKKKSFIKRIGSAIASVFRKKGK